LGCGLGWVEEAQIQSCSPGGVNVPSHTIDAVLRQITLSTCCCCCYGGGGGGRRRRRRYLAKMSLVASKGIFVTENVF